MLSEFNGNFICKMLSMYAWTRSCFRCLLLLHSTIPRDLSVAFLSLNISTAVILLHVKDNAIIGLWA